MHQSLAHTFALIGKSEEKRFRGVRGVRLFFLLSQQEGEVSGEKGEKMSSAGMDTICVLLVLCPFLLYPICEQRARQRVITPVVVGSPVEETAQSMNDALPVVNAHIVR